MNAALERADATNKTIARDWHTTFNALGVAWQPVVPHVAAGLGVRPPVIYLPQSQQLVVVREVVSPTDTLALAQVEKTLPPRLALTGENPDIKLVLALPGGFFTAHVDGTFAFQMANTRSPGPWTEPSLHECAACRGWWFLDGSQGWRCQCAGCGHYDGDNTAARQFTRQVTPWPLTPAPTTTAATRCPPRAWLGVRRA